MYLELFICLHVMTLSLSLSLYIYIYIYRERERERERQRERDTKQCACHMVQYFSLSFVRSALLSPPCSAAGAYTREAPKRNISL